MNIGDRLIVKMRDKTVIAKIIMMNDKKVGIETDDGDLYIIPFEEMEDVKEIGNA